MPDADRSHRFAPAVIVAAAILAAPAGWMLARSQTGAKANWPQPPPAFEPIEIPRENPMSEEKVALGHQLFFDKRLSVDGSRSCYSCHVCEKGLTDGLPTAIGAAGKKLPRSSPTLWNIAYHNEFYWDGRSPSLEKQALAAWAGGNMGADPNLIATMLNAIPSYREQFNKVFRSDATPDLVVRALAAYERTLFCGDTRFDRYERGDKKALSAAEIRGREVFYGKGDCGRCHAGILFTDMLYHNVGIGVDRQEPDAGRKTFSKQEADTGAFKTPTLRDVSKSAPYFHDGSVATLEEAVTLMAAGGRPNPHLDTKNLADRKLTEAEKKDLIAFLKTLDCECTLTEPLLP
jgi:cytochrome c peroxidase